MFSIISNRINIKADRRKIIRKEYSKAEQIPTEILQEILSYLHPDDLSRLGLRAAIARRSIPLVCKAWHGVGMQCLYRRLDFTDDSITSPQPAGLMLRTLKARGDLADYVTELFVPWSFTISKYRTRKNLARKLVCYAQIVSLCHNLVTLSVSTELYSVLFSSKTLSVFTNLYCVLFSSNTLPRLPLQPSITNKLVDLRIIGTGCQRSFIFHPFQSSLSSLRYLELANIWLTALEAPSSPPFPCLPSLETLCLVDVSAETTHAKQIITSLKGTLKNLNIRDYSSYYWFMCDTLPIIGPSLETFETIEMSWVQYCRTYHIDWEPASREEIDRLLPSVSIFSVRADGCGKHILRYLPSSVSVLRIIRPCYCAGGGESSDVSGYDPTVELLDSLTSFQSQFFENCLSLNAIVLAGKACSWQNAEAMHRLELLCKQKGVKVVTMLAEDPCTPNSRNKLHSLPGRTSRVKGFFRDKIAGRFH